MRKLSLKVLTVILACTTINCFAINVSVKSTDQNITGLGFTVDGKKHGGPGTSYHADSMPKGMYAFGVRLKGKDVPCKVDGKRTVKLKTSTSVTLMVGEGKCEAKLGA